jgi:hypothetical protein
MSHGWVEDSGTYEGHSRPFHKLGIGIKPSATSTLGRR